MAERGHDSGFDQRLLQFLQTAGRESVLHAILLGADQPASRRLFAAIERATAPMFEHLRCPRRGLVSVAKALEVARAALEQTLPVLLEHSIVLPPWQRVGLLRDFEQFFAFLRRASINRDGSADLAALSVQAAGAPVDAAWIALEYRLAYIEARLRRGQDFEESRFDEVFGAPTGRDEIQRGQRLSDAHIAMLLGLPLDGFNTLKTIRPSPAALNELNRYTGYVDRSISGRKATAGEVMATHTRGGERLPGADIDKLDLEDDFKTLLRKFKRLKGATE